MASYDDFVNSLLPGNYALTKSMELTKVQTSGTLWYTKKFLVFYYYIFLSNEIFTREYIDKAIEYFDTYIETLDDEVKDSANRFFYPENNAINLKSPSFKTFSSFAALTDFDTQEERASYYQRAKKLYFTLLMNSGGQAGVKKLMKEMIQKPDFVFSPDSIENALLSSAIESAVSNANELHFIKDNSVKYILSSEATENILELSLEKNVTIDEAKDIVSHFPMANPKYYLIENDMVAFIRNERQVMYYYGYFHSKSSGASNIEFSSLTPIGEIALGANSVEFLAIWEHQKVKMISQPETAEINNISPVDGQDNFGISFTPYTDILGHLLRRGALTLSEYQYVVSRKKHTVSNSDWINIENDVLDNLDKIKSVVSGFSRKRDIKSEDSEKELLKYILGIRADMPLDCGKNTLNLVSAKGRNVFCNDIKGLSLVYEIYSKLNDYKILKYGTLFEKCEADLRRRYNFSAHGDAVSMDPKVKIDWDLYNIHLDKFIYLGVMVAIASQKLGISDISEITRDSLENIAFYCSSSFSQSLKNLGIRSASSVKRELLRVTNALRDEDYSQYLENSERRSVDITSRYRTASSEDILARIRDISKEASVAYSEGRTRSSALVSLLKSYYMKCYSENGILKCECCGNETFITESGEPYVEFHHLIPFNIAYGPDHYLNLFALCPDCHRKIHFMSLGTKADQYGLLNKNNYLGLSFVDRLKNLKNQHLLRSYHLEYLLADNAITLDDYNTIAS